MVLPDEVDTGEVREMKLTINPELKWIARDKTGRVFAYTTKPEIERGGWETKDYQGLSAASLAFPDLGPWEESLHEILPDGTLKKYVPELPVDTKMLVRDYDYQPWLKRHFAKFDKDGRVWCWGGGTTSYSGEVHTRWHQWKLYEGD